jgi:hypothetical protein
MVVVSSCKETMGQGKDASFEFLLTFSIMVDDKRVLLMHVPRFWYILYSS